MVDLADLVAVEAQQRIAVENFKLQVVQKVRDTPIEGVTPICSSPVVFTVKLSQLENWCVSPEYYSPDRQSDIVGSALTPAKTATEVVNKLRALVTDKKVKSDKLNPRTVRTLEAQIPQSLKGSD